MLFTYKIYKQANTIELIPTDNFYKQFGYASRSIISSIITGRSINSSITTGIDNKSIIFDIKFLDITTDLCYELIQFCINMIGEYINFEYYTSEHGYYTYWTFTFKITNINLLLELL